MQLSEAIRLGSMMKPQAFGRINGPIDGPRGPGDVLGLRFVLGSCALGAAYDAGFVYRGASVDVHETVAHCPVCWVTSYGGERARVNGIVMHLNDDHRWTRERIADWVESVERRIESAQRHSAVDPVEREARSDHHCLTTRG